MGILSFLGGAIKPITDLIGDMHTSTEEKMEARVALMQLENEIKTQMLDLEKQLLASKASIIIAEAQSESWITRSWRPLTMVTFVVLIVLISAGIMDTEALNEVPDRLWTLLTLGIGGYIGVRTVEKGINKFAKMKENSEA